MTNTSSLVACRPEDSDYVIGVDLGTSGIRATAASPQVGTLATANRPVESISTEPGNHEQDPEQWWRLLIETLSDVTSQMKGEAPRAIAVTSTSGSLVAVDESGVPVRPAIMYDDLRAASAARWLNELDGSGRWNYSHSLAKAVWVRDNEPKTWKSISRLLHPADWLMGRLSGVFHRSDYSNCLKLGFDAKLKVWTSTIDAAGLDRSLLPEVGEPGKISSYSCPDNIGGSCLKNRVPLVPAGTDGLASLISSGASAEGDANTTIGTTIVWKLLSTQPMPHLPGTYNHRHPAGLWAPGAASNAGGACLRFGVSDFETWNAASEPLLPTKIFCYPLAGVGERFPFESSTATSFLDGQPADDLEMHAARLQGIAFIERWGYEQLEAAGCSVGPSVFSAGSVCTGDVSGRLRASILGRSILRADYPSAAFGAAILAASPVWFGGDVAASIRKMVRITSRMDPQPQLQAEFEEYYYMFRRACRDRGYGR